MNSFAHFPLNSHLNEFISLIWELEGKENYTESILPSGVVEIVFNLSAPMSAIFPDGSKIEKAPRCFIQGIHSNIIQVKYKARHHLFGLRLKSYALKGLLGIIPSEINNQAVDLSLIHSKYDALWHQLNDVNTFSDRVKIVDKFFRPREINNCLRTQTLNDLFFEDGSRLYGSLDYDISFGKNDKAFESVEKLAQQVCFSSRHLNRKSKELFGLTAEDLIRYKKFLRSVELIHGEKFSLSEIAHLAGFFDQSHFIRTFKSFTSMTPKMYQQNKSSLPYHLFS